MPYNTDRMSSTLLDLTSASLNEAKARDQRVKTADFIATQESRQKRQIAEDDLGTKQAEMDKEVAEDRDAGDRHITHARASDAAQTSKAQASKISSDKDKEYDLTSGVKDQDSWEVAWHTGSGLGMDTEQLESVLGPQEAGFNANFIAGSRQARAFRREDNVKLAEIESNDRASKSRAQIARMEMAGRLTIAEAELQGRLAQAGAAASETGRFDIQNSPFDKPEYFATAVAANLGEDPKEAAVKQASNMAFRMFKELEFNGYARANEFKQLYPNRSLPETLDPTIMSKYWIQRAITSATDKGETTAAREKYTRKEKAFYDEGAATIGVPGSVMDRLWLQEEHRGKSAPEMLDAYVNYMMNRGAQDAAR